MPVIVAFCLNNSFEEGLGGTHLKPSSGRSNRPDEEFGSWLAGIAIHSC